MIYELSIFATQNSHILNLETKLFRIFSYFVISYSYFMSEKNW